MFLSEKQKEKLYIIIITDTTLYNKCNTYEGKYSSNYLRNRVKTKDTLIVMRHNFGITGKHHTFVVYLELLCENLFEKNESTININQ